MDCRDHLDKDPLRQLLQSCPSSFVAVFVPCPCGVCRVIVFIAPHHTDRPKTLPRVRTETRHLSTPRPLEPSYWVLVVGLAWAKVDRWFWRLRGLPVLVPLAFVPFEPQCSACKATVSGNLSAALSIAPLCRESS